MLHIQQHTKSKFSLSISFSSPKEKNSKKEKPSIMAATSSPNMSVFHARSAIISGDIETTDEINEMTKKTREIVARCAQDVIDLLTKYPNARFDTGRVLHSLDLLENVKDTLCVAFVLPQYKNGGKKE